MTVVEGKLCGEGILAHVPQVGVEEDDIADALWILNSPIQGDRGPDVVNDERNLFKPEG
jgi:hypothetical protein